MVTGQTVAAYYVRFSAALLGNEASLSFHTVLHRPTALCSESQMGIIPSSHLKYDLVYHHAKQLSSVFIKI